jgi:hypothetical protein
MTADTYENYMRDLGGLLRDLALEARRDRDAARGSADESFRSGYLMAFHCVISLLQQQAAAFQIPLEGIRLADLDPEADLL